MDVFEALRLIVNGDKVRKGGVVYSRRLQGINCDDTKTGYQSHITYYGFVTNNLSSSFEIFYSGR